MCWPTQLWSDSRKANGEGWFNGLKAVWKESCVLKVMMIMIVYLKQLILYIDSSQIMFEYMRSYVISVSSHKQIIVTQT